MGKWGWFGCVDMSMMKSFILPIGHQIPQNLAMLSLINQGPELQDGTAGRTRTIILANQSQQGSLVVDTVQNLASTNFTLAHNTRVQLWLLGLHLWISFGRVLILILIFQTHILNQTRLGVHIHLCWSLLK